MAFPVLDYSSAKRVISGQAPMPQPDPEGVVQLSGPTSSKTGTTAAPPEQPNTQPRSTNSEPSPTTPTATSLSEGSPNSFNLPTPENLPSEIASLGGGLDTAVQSFYDEAGPSRTWSSVGGPGVMQRAVGLQSSPENIGKAKDLVSASYAGPEGLDYSPQNLADISAAVNAMSSGRGIVGYTGAIHPSLSPGQARFEAQRSWGNPQLRQQGMENARQLREFTGRLGGEQTRAEDFAAQRKAEEARISQRSRDWLGNRQDRVLGVLDEAARAANEANARTDAAYADLMSGDMTEEEARAAGLGDLWTSVNESAAEADRVWTEIMDEYPGIRDIPPMELGSNKKGGEREFFTYRGIKFNINNVLHPNYMLELNSDDQKILGLKTPADYDRFKKELYAVAKHVWERERKLEARFGVIGQKVGSGKDPFGRSGLSPFASEPGDLAIYHPLYYGDAFNDPSTRLPDPRNYISETSQQNAAPENIATKNQDKVLDAIATLLDEAQFEMSDNPFKAARIIAETDRYLSDQEAAVEARGGALDEAMRLHLNRLRAERARWKRAHRFLGIF